MPEEQDDYFDFEDNTKNRIIGVKDEDEFEDLINEKKLSNGGKDATFVYLN